MSNARPTPHTAPILSRKDAGEYVAKHGRYLPRLELYTVGFCGQLLKSECTSDLADQVFEASRGTS